MSDKNGRASVDSGRLYTLIMSLKDEVARLSVQIKAMRKEIEGVKMNEN